MNITAQLIKGKREIENLFFSPGLLSKSLRGGSILAVGSLIENLFRFARNIILARLLDPEAFGLMATVISSVTVIEAVTQIGLRQSTIQNIHGSDEGFLNSIWWISSLRGLVLYLIALFASPYISAYFNNPDAVLLLRIGFSVIFINGLISPHVHILEKELRFKNWVLLMQGAGIAGVITAIILAFVFHNVWALLSGYIVDALLRVIISFIVCPLKPQLNIDKIYRAEIMQFSRRLFGLPLIMMLYAQADIFVIGKVLSIQQLGIYVLVKSLSEMPMDFFSKIVHPVILPVFSSMQDDHRRLNTALLSATRTTGILGTPFIAFTALFAEPILQTAYGQEYSKLSLPYGILSLSVLMMIIASLIVQTYFAIGRPHLHRTASVVRTGIFLILIYPATKLFGLPGAASVALLATIILVFVQLLYARKVINLSLRTYWQSLLPGIKLALFILIPGIILHIVSINKGLGFLFTGIILCLVAWGYGIFKTGLFREHTISAAI
jgi:lipopolysaccharide exporter